MRKACFCTDHRIVHCMLQCRRIAVEADGPAHFTLSRPFRALGRKQARRRCLQARGMHVLSVPFYEWRQLKTAGPPHQHTISSSGGAAASTVDAATATAPSERPNASQYPFTRKLEYLRAALDAAAATSAPVSLQH